MMADISSIVSRVDTDCRDNNPYGCVLRSLSGEWTTHILCVLSRNGPTRFGELKRRVEGISSKVLTDRLRMLEAEMIISRECEPTIPPKVTYSLTAMGQELEQGLKAMEAVAQRWKREHP
jgi:DNA-binding HxlR family transcriptional regulator